MPKATVSIMTARTVVRLIFVGAILLLMYSCPGAQGVDTSTLHGMPNVMGNQISKKSLIRYHSSPALVSMNMGRNKQPQQHQFPRLRLNGQKTPAAAVVSSSNHGGSTGIIGSGYDGNNVAAADGYASGWEDEEEEEEEKAHKSRNTNNAADKKIVASTGESQMAPLSLARNQKTPRYEGKVVIITGSSSGIGQEAALHFAQEGASVTIHGTKEDKLKITEKKLMDTGVPEERILKVITPLDADGAADKIIEGTLEKFGQIDVLVNNAGTGGRPDIINETDNIENLDFIYRINLRVIVELCEKALPHLRVTEGNILNVGSVRSVKILPKKRFYAMMKAALDHYTRGLAQMAAPGVRVNSLNPGHVDTPIHAENKKTEGFMEQYTKDTPLGRLGTVEEMANIIVFLCSSDASFVTGHIMFADGGVSVKSN